MSAPEQPDRLDLGKIELRRAKAVQALEISPAGGAWLAAFPLAGDMPKLIAEVKRLQAEVERLRAEVERLETDAENSIYDMKEALDRASDLP